MNILTFTGRGGRGLIDVPPHVEVTGVFYMNKTLSVPVWVDRDREERTGTGRKGGAGNTSRVLRWPQQRSFSPGLGGLESFYEHKKNLVTRLSLTSKKNRPRKLR